MTRAFEGLRVIDATHVLAGPFAAYQLAVLGADVIKIDRPDDPDQVRIQGPDRELNAANMGTAYLAQGANKRSLALNLKIPSGRDALRELLKTADVFIQNFRPGALEALGLHYDEIKRLNPRLIYCSISAFGHTGPRRNETGYDNVFQAISGLMAVTGTPEVSPLKSGAPVVDYSSGYMAAFSITAALYQRTQTGAGQHIDLSMFDATLMLMSTHITALTAANKTPKPEGNRYAVAGLGTYDTSDGKLMLGAANMRQQKRLWEALDRPDMVKKNNNERFDDYAQEEVVLTEIFATRSAAEWEIFLRDHKVPAGRVRGLEEALNDPQLKTRCVLHKLPSHKGQKGEYSVPVAPFHMSAGNPAIDRPPPRLGEHSVEILQEIGLAHTQIDAMITEGATLQSPQSE